MDKKQYSDEVRLCLYKCILSSVPIESAGPLIQFVLSKLGNCSLSQVPSSTLTAQAAYELGVLSLIQFVSSLLCEDHITLSWDATSLDGGKASDYTDHVLSAFADAASVYARYKDVSEAEVLSQLQRKI